MSLVRLFRIASEAVRFAVSSAAERLPGFHARQQGPQRLCGALTRLGVTFVKVGQALGLRRDLLRDDYVLALQSLQDRVAPFPARDALREIERGLGRPEKQLFAHFDRRPLAAASVAQVHAARLHDGREVIVKVRRAGLDRQIDADLHALTTLSRVAAAFLPWLRHYQPQRIIEEIGKNLRKEIDFRQEARNIRRFAAAFAEWPTIRVPGVIDELVSESVIVQEHSGGRRIDDPAVSPNGPRLAQHFVDAYLHQIFVMGIFHGDPHPGNLFITPDGRICFHDFGLVGVLDRATRRNLAAFTHAFIRQDADWLLDAAIDLGILGSELDRAEFRRGLAEILVDYAALPLKEWSMADAFLRVTRLGQEKNILVPYDLLVLMRALFLIEHAVRALDPEFQLLDTLLRKGPEVLKATMELPADGPLDRLKHDILAAMQDAPAVVAASLRRLRREGDGLALRICAPELTSLQEHVDRSSNRLALAGVTLGLYIAGSLLMQHSIGPRLYGEMPALAAFAYALALWFTLRLVRGIARSGRL